MVACAESQPGHRTSCAQVRDDVVVLEAIASGVVILAGCFAVVLRKRVERRTGFWCAFRILDGSMQGLSRRWRHGYWEAEGSPGLWRRWPTYRRQELPAIRVVWDQGRPLRRFEWVTINSQCRVLPVEYEGGAHGEIALLPSRIDIARRHLGADS